MSANDYYIHYNFHHYIGTSDSPGYGITYNDPNGDRDINSAYNAGQQKINLFTNSGKNSILQKQANKLQNLYTAFLKNNQYDKAREAVTAKLNAELQGRTSVISDNISCLCNFAFSEFNS